ncbi:uncharacterized protein SCHCODRAFT_02066261 [Schizophyllum commune H4-8]|uniref:uncharacterized protein n=1 Tax=Schizophyllum commune (strain H4-8 / FGSC 9210) TaxID=578458 RepID=UPI002160DE7A|nr:uncharacterized protein SCHCODRAFT_02066261 [Schizophyllum commune H4-8]KAI5887465.1 hypothetical protein SCHCODRAFT_02066261 [Schizophyllum commune H4-8]
MLPASTPYTRHRRALITTVLITRLPMSSLVVLFFHQHLALPMYLPHLQSLFLILKCSHTHFAMYLLLITVRLVLSLRLIYFVRLSLSCIIKRAAHAGQTRRA